MLEFLRYGLDISTHNHKGVYSCQIGKNRKQTRASTHEVICTLRKGQQESVPNFDTGPEIGPKHEHGPKHDPITLTYQGTPWTLRPWDPYACVIAAGIRNRLIHFPIRSGSGVLALGCSLQTLSHIADVVGSDGRLIGVFNEAEDERPSSEELRTFYKSHPGVSVVVEKIHSATLESYERLLSLPLSSKYAFLMALHERLGAKSPARTLLRAEQPTRIARHIFSFLDSGDAPDVRCLVVCHWPPGTCIEDIRSVVLSHVHILQQWRASRKIDEQANTAADSESGDGEETAEKDAAEKSTGVTDTNLEGSKRRSKDEQESAPLWIFLRLPTDGLSSNSQDGCVNKKLLQAVANLKKLPSGPRTGLVAKEQLLLAPYFPNHALLLLKYFLHRDARSSKTTKKSIPSPPGLPFPSEGAPPDERPPSSGSVPVPSFAPKFAAPPEPPAIPMAAAAAAAAATAAAAAAAAAAATAASASSSTSAPTHMAAASSSATATSALIQPSSLDVPKPRKANDRSLIWLDTQGHRLDAQVHEQAPPQNLSVGLCGDPAVNPLPADALAALDYLSASTSGPALGGAQEIGLPVQRHSASLPLGAGGALVPRSKGPVGLDNARGAPQMVPGRHPSNIPGPVAPGPLEHFGSTLGAVDLSSAPYMGDNRGQQMWGLQQVGPPSHMAPPGLWGEGYGPEPVPVGPAAHGGWGPPSYVHYGGGKGGGAPSPADLVKGSSWRDVPGANGQGGVGAPAQSGSVPPHIDQLQYMAMSF